MLIEVSKNPRVTSRDLQVYFELLGNGFVTPPRLMGINNLSSEGLRVTPEQERDSPLPVPLVILPFMKHGDLRRFLIATRYGDIPMFVPHQSLLRFMVDIAVGMEYLSSKGFTHRGLAARNCIYEVMLSCWHRELGQRPGFRELGERLKALLCELPPLEASQEVHYINQGLEAANGVPTAVYLRGLWGLGLLLNRPKEEEEGYLLGIQS